jgi:hypothetical protein
MKDSLNLAMTQEFRSNRFVRISDNLITQDMLPPKLTITFEGPDKANIKIDFPIGYKTGLIDKRADRRDYYRGGEPDYNIIVEYSDKEKNSINDLIIPQIQSGAEFHYIAGKMSDLRNEIITKQKDHLNRPLEEIECDSIGLLYKTRYYKYLDDKHVVEKKIIDHQLRRTYFQRIINNETLEEDIFRDNGELKQTNVWKLR